MGQGMPRHRWRSGQDVAHDAAVEQNDGFGVADDARDEDREIRVSLPCSDVMFGLTATYSHAFNAEWRTI